jgi:hypothetical protein
MPLNPTTLAAAIVSNWRASSTIGFSDPLTTEQEAIIQALADGVAAAVVAHITSSAVVAVTGVTPGSGAAAGTVT